MANEFKIKTGLILGATPTQPVKSITDSSDFSTIDASSTLVTANAISGFVDAQLALFLPNASIGQGFVWDGSMLDVNTGNFVTNASVNAIFNNNIIPIESYVNSSTYYDSSFGKVNKTGDTMSGNLTLNSSLYVSGKIQFNSAAVGLPATSGTAQPNGCLRFSSSSITSKILDFGIAGATGGWIQSSNAADLTDNYPLLLNPNGGNIGIGTTAPPDIFSIRNDVPNGESIGISIQNYQYANVNGATSSIKLVLYSGQYGKVEAIGAGTTGSVNRISIGMIDITLPPYNQYKERFYVRNDGIVGINALASGSLTSASGVITSSSDENLKTPDGFIETAIDKVMQLKPRYFYWNAFSGLDTSIRQLGFYAQEVNKALGEEVANTPSDGRNWGFYDRGIIAMLTKAVQELTIRLKILENKNK